jgi:hypothetical protein
MISLFVRSYPKDFEWLHHSVRSMRKNLIGISDRVLTVPHGSQIPDDISSFFDRIYYSIETHPGYLAQQIDKVRAYKQCKYTDILFSDSDCIYYAPYDARKMIVDGKITLYKTRYSSLSGDVLTWRPITHVATGILPEWEYMRCFPMMHKSFVCKALDESTVYNSYLKILQPNNLSEFNALGIIADTYYSEHYNFIDTDISLPTQSTKQYWSWGGITPDIRKELQTL